MSMSHRSMHVLRAAMPLFVLACIVTVSPLAGQQRLEAVNVVLPPQISPPALRVTLLGPRLAPLVQPVGLPSALERTGLASANAAVGTRHTIVISTLALVLITILVVLLVVD